MKKLGFLGGGVDSIAGRVHFIASRMDNGFEVVGGIFSLNKEKSKISAKEYGVKHFESMEEMASEVDYIVVLTPTPLHFQNLIELSKYDTRIIVDKPLVSNLDEALKVKELYKNKTIITTYNYSGYPLIRELKSIIRNNILGKIKKVIISMPQEAFFKPFKLGYPQEWRKKDGIISNLELDLGVHILHLAYFLIGDFKITHKRLNSFSNVGVIDDCEMWGEFESGIISFNCSKIMLGNQNSLQVEIYGDKASAKWNHNNPEELIISYFDGKKEIVNRSNAKYEANKKRYNRMTPGHPTGFIEAFANYYHDIYEGNDFVDDLNVSVDILKKLSKVFR